MVDKIPSGEGFGCCEGWKEALCKVRREIDAKLRDEANAAGLYKFVVSVHHVFSEQSVSANDYNNVGASSSSYDPRQKRYNNAQKSSGATYS
ncbi:hypothetical protein Tco_0487328 [Tanacetum coccineum]